MARAQKRGIDYFSFDVGFFADRKIKILNARFGSDGIMIYLYILTEIYKNGFYIKYDEDFEYIISSDLNMNHEKIGLIINFLLERSLFDNTLFISDKVLTSHGIQQRFQEAVASRGAKNAIEIDTKFWILNESETKPYIKFTHFQHYSSENSLNSMENNLNSSEKYIKESKVNKSKVNKSKVKESNRNPELATIVDTYQNNIAPITPLVYEKIADWLNDVDISLIEYAIDEATSRNKRNWSYINAIIKSHFACGRKTRLEAEEENNKPKKNVEKKNSRYDFDAIQKKAFMNVNGKGGQACSQ